MDRALRGSCACGRIRYVIEIPAAEAQLAELRYDNSNAARHHQASPLTLWLRVPLPWFHSATFAQFPDETHASIQRTFVSPFAAAAQAHNSRRTFCGYCGTPLTAWHERTRDDAEYILLTVGSLLDEDQEALGDFGWLPGDSSDEETTAMAVEGLGRGAERVQQQHVVTRGVPWFEELVEETRLGKVRKQRGGFAARDDGVRVEWEVVEWTEGDDEAAEGESGKGKRKIGDVEGEDLEMRIV
ncbi:hypothetical protein K432DRAFT_377248 [Lepidopterella palustris CBS 459.81]|uniref:CENP-V/GFA domain-containing protein n=1 Tax=Lepidopterella palustris CBS 459.81 TaxID=1314670 RepID=A0A8E2EL98_9PEZI|nr:hypothetical protein K432DRAFT_377248 [Lepidopterella palustris CBS 459.81]